MVDEEQQTKEQQRPPAFQEAARVQTSFTAPIERRVLPWMAARLPRWVNSDHLTLLGFLAMLLAGASYATVRWSRAGLILATIFLFFNWLGDSLDGTLARVRQQLRPRYGFYVDHVIDTVGSFFLVGGLAMSGLMKPRIAAGMLIAYLMLSAEVYLATHTLGKFKLSFGKFGPTELRILLASGNTALFVHGDVPILGNAFPLFNLGGSIAIIGMVLTLIISIGRNACQLYREETPPKRQRND
jgi:archaetidylinositol phosphate synthase